jgi:hypothetical protein
LQRACQLLVSRTSAAPLPCGPPLLRLCERLSTFSAQPSPRPCPTSRPPLPPCLPHPPPGSPTLRSSPARPATTGPPSPSSRTWPSLTWQWAPTLMHPAQPPCHPSAPRPLATPPCRRPRQCLLAVCPGMCHLAPLAALASQHHYSPPYGRRGFLPPAASRTLLARCHQQQAPVRPAPPPPHAAPTPCAAPPLPPLPPKRSWRTTWWR